MKVIGEIDTSGQPMLFTESVEVVSLGNRLVDSETGMVMAVKDSYGDWVNPRMMNLGLKIKVMTE